VEIVRELDGIIVPNFGKTKLKKYEIKDAVNFSYPCFLISKKTWETLEGFDKRIQHLGFDIILNTYAFYYGLPIVEAIRCKMLHYGDRTTLEPTEQSEWYWQRLRSIVELELRDNAERYAYSKYLKPRKRIRR